MPSTISGHSQKVDNMLRNQWTVCSGISGRLGPEFVVAFPRIMQSICSNPRNKGLIEGLMLKRAKATIYMGQESDTLGKDSELASTLAQSNPVIAYFPMINVKEHIKSIAELPLDYFYKRIYILNAEKIFDEASYESDFNIISPDYIDILSDFADQVNLYYKNISQFSLDYESENKFKSKEFRTIRTKQDLPKEPISYNFEIVCRLISLAEKLNYNKRAFVLSKVHPLSMQIDMKKGVANGVLVIRNAKDCTDLLFNLFTNSCSFEILNIVIPGIQRREDCLLIKSVLEERGLKEIANKLDYSENELSIICKRYLSETELEEIICLQKNDRIPVHIGVLISNIEKNRYTILKEQISGCTYRVVTGDKKITNSFWNLFFKDEGGKNGN